MQTTVSINAPNATVTIEHTGEMARVTDTLEQVALYAFNHGYYTAPEGVEPASITFDSLTNAQKLTLFTKYVQVAILSAAQSQYVEDAVEAARITAAAADIFI